MGKKGYIVLESGQKFEGISFGYEKKISGEIVFNTAMTGYPESFTDPSYFGQILVTTYPLIGNYGVPSEKIVDNLSLFYESNKAHIRALVVSSYIENKNHWNADSTLSDWLIKQEVPALYGIDTRTLTQIIREKGVMKAVLTFDEPRKEGLIFQDINRDNLVAAVSCKKPMIYGKGSITIALIDCGLKENQIKLLLKQNVRVLRVPWNYDLFGTPHNRFDAVMISNGPGDPKMAKETINTVRKALRKRIPTFGICLGNQILALAAGANTYKLKYGHRSQNQPVRDEVSGKCYITTQNHGFTVDTKTIPSGWSPWFTNLNDKTNEGIRATTGPFFSVQFHPESTPGPTDTEWLFSYFINEVKRWHTK